METGSRFPISGAILDVAIYQLLATTQPPGTVNHLLHHCFLFEINTLNLIY
jgi:hypothetical protein